MSQPTTEPPTAEALSDSDAATFRVLLSGLERSLETDRRAACQPGVVITGHGD